MDSEVRHIVEFDEKALSVLTALTRAIEENNHLERDGNPNEFAREVCANIYADILINNLFSNGFNQTI